MTTMDSGTPAAPPTSYRLRQASTSLLREVTDFYNLCEIAEFGEPDYELEEVEEEWSDLNLDRDVLLLESGDGVLVGAMTVFPRAAGIYDASGYVHPEHQGRGIGAYLVGSSEQRVMQEADSLESAGTALIRNWVATINEPANQLLREHGYQQVKRFARMEIALEDEPEEPTFPQGVELRALDLDRDIRGIYEVVDESFSEHWSGAPRTFEYWRKFAVGAGFEPRLWTQAFRGDRRIAVAIGRNVSDYGWIQWVGVLKDERGKGLGAALLRHQFQQFWRLGTRTIGLGVDSENTTGAVDLYQRVGMRTTRSHDAYEKTLSF